MKWSIQTQTVCVIVGLSLVSCSALSQRVYVNGDSNIDSIFNVFEAPSLPSIPDSIVRSRIVFSIHVFALVWIDTAGRVQNITAVPLHGIGNDLPMESKLWDAVQASIEEVSRNWIFKPTLYDTASFPKENRQTINSSAALRPNYGRQSHAVVLSFYPDDDTPLYDKLYGVDIVGGKPSDHNNGE